MTDSLHRQSPSTPSGPPSGGRHLKRLSLSLSATSPSSPLSNSSFANSPLSSRGTPPSFSSPASPPSATGRGHAPRHLRLSMSGSPSFSSFDPPSSAPADPSSSSSSIFTPKDLDSPSPSARRAPSSAGGSNSWNSPISSRSPNLNGPSPSPRNGHGHARRQSSISYSTSSTPSLPPLRNGDSPSFPGPGSPSSSFSRSRTSSHNNLSSPISESPTTRASSINTVLANSVQEEDENEENSGFLSPNRTGAAIGAQPTLTELNADLLSFIAKKERKCLDLREELKRNEDDLAALKRKWEGIVAKSLASSTPPTTTSLPRPGAVENARKATAARAAAAGDISPTLSTPPQQPPRPTTPLHTLDLSLLSSTFDSTSYDSDGQDAADIDKEIGESVQAAKAWMGGVLGKVLEVVGGSEDPSANNSPRLDVLKEEEEEPEETSSSSPSAKFSPPGISSDASATSDERRDSHASTMSDVSHGSTSSFGFGFGSGSSAGRGSTNGSAASESTVAESSGTEATRRPLLNGEVEPEQQQQHSRPIPRTRPPAADGGHNRRRSTFDMLGSAAGAGWGSLNKRWNAVADSEYVKSSKRATLSLVDNLEKTLTETLGPLDPPSPQMGGQRQLSNEGMAVPQNGTEVPQQKSPALAASALPSGAGVFASWSRVAPTTAAMTANKAANGNGGDPDRTPKSKNDEFDWSAFLDDKAPGEMPPPVEQPRLGGYRRPSHAKGRTMAAAPNLMEDMIASPPLPAPIAPSPRLAGSPKSAGRRKTPSVTSPSPAQGVIKEEPEQDAWGW